jgi:hypothetical protein
MSADEDKGGAGRPAWAFGHTLVLAAGVLALIAFHGLVLRYFARHMALPATLVAIVAALVVLKHLGLFAALAARIRPRR